MPVYKMHKYRAIDNRKEGTQYFHAASESGADCLAKAFGYDLNSVKIVSADEVAKIESTSIETIDPNWLIAASRLVRKPISTIAWGVVLGTFFVMLVGFALSFLLGILTWNM